MKHRKKDFHVRIRGNAHRAPLELISGKHFSLNPTKISDCLSLPLSAAEQDLVRVGMAIYAVDRSVRRSPAANDRSAGRELDLEIPVSNPDLWNSQVEALSGVLSFLGEDVWRFHFVEGCFDGPPCGYLFQHVPNVTRVCLYSAGLDSMAGLGIRLAETREQYFAVTARHRSSLPPPLNAQFCRFAKLYGPRIFKLMIPTTLIHAERMDQQELSQRCRAFLFCSLAGAVASRLGVSEVEIFENGVGALNLPPMNGMLWGGRATRGCHPHFLRLMSSMVSAVADRPTTFVLPFKHWTKGEMVGELARLGLGDMLNNAVSCVHFPRRVLGSAKQCGICPACIGSRHAAIVAGVDLSPQRFEHDILDPKIDDLPTDVLAHLRQHVLQAADLHELRADGSRPQILRRHLASSRALTNNDTAEFWVQLLGKYRDEWKMVATVARDRGCRWPQWLEGCDEITQLSRKGGFHERVA
jgi:7-cyano-7-deazaguanine synthase in queuosine biosynthesis